MGSNLSCMSKNKVKHSKRVQSNGNSPKQKQSTHPGSIDDSTEYVASGPIKQSNSSSLSNAKAHQSSDVKTSELEPLIPLISAPAGYHLPSPFIGLEKLAKIPEPSSEELLVSVDADSPSHKNQPVDQEARKIARSGPRPLNWRDLHYNLIGSRNFNTDEERVRALFSWLCSLDVNRDVFPNQAMKDREHKKLPHLDTVERVLNALIDGRSSYFQAFQTLCNHSGIECHVIRGIAKGVAYEIGQKLVPEDTSAPLINPKTHKFDQKVAHLEHAWNACKIDGKWRLFDPSWAAKRLAVGLPEEDGENKENKSPAQSPLNRASQAVLIQYQTDMFYFMTEPSRLFYTHYPNEQKWQLLRKAGSLKTFQDCVLLKPSFFRYGLALYSHREGYVPVKNELTLKILLPEMDPEKLLFTYNLSLEGSEQINQNKNLSSYGMHTISLREKIVTFKFRFPKLGVYKLLIYARMGHEALFADVCEYKIYALFDLPDANLAKTTSKEDPALIIPFPPCNQSSYGPTAKAALYGLQTQPLNLDPVLSAKGGIVEIRFCQSDSQNELPKLAARLKSIRMKDGELNNCILHRQIEACKSTTGMSSMWTTTSSQGPCIPMNVVTAYLPAVGEYALEIFAKPGHASEEESYHLVWQFLINSDQCWILSEEAQDRLAVIEMGPREPNWSQLGFRTLSHQDPLIRIPTIARTGADLKVRQRTEKELLSEFAATHSTMSSHLTHSGTGFGGEGSDMGSQVTVIDRSLEMDSHDVKSDRTDVTSPISMAHRTLSPVEEALSEIRPRDCDIQVTIEAVDKTAIMLLAQMVDISINNADEQDVTDYILRDPEDDDDRLHKDILSGGLSDSNLESSASHPNVPGDRITYLIRVPKGGRFYKLFFYACPKDMDPGEQIPLVFTYLIEAPARLTSAEIPYIGSLGGPFPEKAQNSHNVSLRT